MTEPQNLPLPEDPEASLAAVVALRRTANQLELAAVTQAIRQGWTWADVGQSLGISAQAAHKKFAAAVRANAVPANAVRANAVRAAGD